MTISQHPNQHHALALAQDVAGAQSYPSACLYMVATPIGNLADISLRALYVLHMVDAIACEDTRHTQALLHAWGISKSTQHILALHQHNEQQATHMVLERLQAGQRIAYVSDAGTPAISDPGAILVQAVHAAQLQVMPIPGACSIIAALSASGIHNTPHANGISGLDNGWVFAGFLPTKTKVRQHAIDALCVENRAVIVLEAPHRIVSLCKQLATLAQRPVTIARELTKQFETITTMPAHALAAWLAEDKHRCKGEFVIVIHPQTTTIQNPADNTLTDEQQRILQLLLNELPVSAAARLASEITGAARKQCYAQALLWQT